MILARRFACGKLPHEHGCRCHRVYVSAMSEHPCVTSHADNSLAWANGSPGMSAALMYRQGISALPRHCLALCAGFFLGAMAISALRDVLPQKWARFVPIPMAAAIPFYIGAQLAVRCTAAPPRDQGCGLGFRVQPSRYPLLLENSLFDAAACCCLPQRILGSFPYFRTTSCQCSGRWYKGPCCLCG